MPHIQQHVFHTQKACILILYYRLHLKAGTLGTFQCGYNSLLLLCTLSVTPGHAYLSLAGYEVSLPYRAVYRHSVSIFLASTNIFQG